MLLVSSPWVGFTNEPQWHRVHLVPFTDPADKLLDVAGNVLLFVPFGYFAAGHWNRKWGLMFALGAAVAVSTVAEATQLFSTLRYPSATDVTAGVIGTAIGFLIRHKPFSRAARPSPKPWTS